MIVPTTVIFFPGDTAAVFHCEVNPSIIAPAWEVDGVIYRLDQILNVELPGHNVNGTSIIVTAPVNDTEYVCVIPQATLSIRSYPAFLYISGKLWAIFVIDNRVL